MGYGPKSFNLADLTRKWCSGNTWGFDLHNEGSSPFFLRSWEGFNLRKSLYQSGPWAFRHGSVIVGVVGLGVQLVGRHVIELGLVLVVGNFFTLGV